MRNKKEKTVHKNGKEEAATLVMMLWNDKLPLPTI